MDGYEIDHTNHEVSHTKCRCVDAMSGCETQMDAKREMQSKQMQSKWMQSKIRKKPNRYRDTMWK